MALDTRIPLQTQVANPGRNLGNLANAIVTREKLDAQADRDKSNEETANLQRQRLLQQIDSQGKEQSLVDMARDSVQIRSLMQSGDIQGARNFAIDRVTRLNERRKAGENVNTIHTERFLQALEADPEQARQMLDNEIQGFAQLGLVKTVKDLQGRDVNKVFAPVTLTNDETNETIKAFPTYNSATGVAELKPADIPDGFRVAVETPEQERQRDLLAAQQREIDKLNAKLDAEPQIASEVQLAKDAVARSKELFGQVDKINVNISNLREAQQALRDGANTGPIISMWPSFTEASVRLDNVQSRLGLDVVGSTTFGALSKGELDLSLQNALPTNLTPPELADWVDRRIDAQNKKAEYLQRQAVFLSQKTDGKQNTQADWVKSEKAALQAALDAFGATEEDIEATMEANDMDRSQVLTEIRRRHERGGS